MDTISNENLSTIIANAETYAILTHKRPDGDALASSLAMFWYLIDIGKKASNIDVIIPEFIADFSFICGIEHLKKLPTKDNYDMIIVVDCANQRLLEGVSILKQAKQIICFDHHEETLIHSTYSKIDTFSPSCTCLIYETFCCNNKNFLNCIATGLISDTGNFTLNASQKGKDILKELGCAGVDINDIISKTFSQNNRTMELVHLVTDRGILASDNSTFCTYLLQKDLLSTEKSLSTVNHKSIISELQKLGNFTNLIFLIENNRGEFKGSLRTLDSKLDLNEICCKLVSEGKFTKGGGHSYSAGCTIPVDSFENIQDIFERIVLEVSNYFS